MSNLYEMLRERPVHKAICRELGVEDFEAEDDLELYVDTVEAIDGQVSERRIHGKKVWFKIAGKKYGVRLEPITETKRVNHENYSFFERLFGLSGSRTWHELDNRKMLEALYRAVQQVKPK